MMNAQSTAFAYDEFEQFLLDAAKIDQAPSDFPARLGVALGLGVPILVATKAAFVLPTTTALSGSGVAEVGSAVAPTGLFAAVKVVLGVGASTLLSTAAKGITVGLLSGAAVLGTGYAAVKLANHGSDQSNAVVPVSMSHRSEPSGMGSPQGIAVTTPPASMPAPEERLAGESALPADADDHAGSEAKHLVAVGAGFDRYALGIPSDVATNKPVTRLPRPIFPENTTAIARYPLLFDNVSALYDDPRRIVRPPPVAVANPEPMIDPAELLAMRTKTVQRSRTLLGQSKAALALSELDDFRKRVGEKNFGADELLLRIEALAVLGRAKEAQADVEIVERLAPNSAALRQAQLLARSRFVR